MSLSIVHCTVQLYTKLYISPLSTVHFTTLNCTVHHYQLFSSPLSTVQHPAVSPGKGLAYHKKGLPQVHRWHLGRYWQQTFYSSTVGWSKCSAVYSLYSTFMYCVVKSYVENSLWSTNCGVFTVEDSPGSRVFKKYLLSVQMNIRIYLWPQNLTNLCTNIYFCLEILE